MKKFFSVLLVMVCLIVPVSLLVGCGKNTDARNVKNRVYYIEVAKRDEADMTTVLESNLRISFYDKLFKLEVGESGKKGYAYYAGNYTAKDDTVTFEVLEYGGDFAGGAVPSHLKLESLEYKDGQLKKEFLNESGIVRYVFKAK